MIEIRHRYDSSKAARDAFLVYDRGGHLLATVEWYARWRCYVVSPDSRAVFSPECLRVLADFCERQEEPGIESHPRALQILMTASQELGEIAVMLDDCKIPPARSLPERVEALCRELRHWNESETT